MRWRLLSPQPCVPISVLFFLFLLSKTHTSTGDNDSDLISQGCCPQHHFCAHLALILPSPLYVSIIVGCFGLAGLSFAVLPVQVFFFKCLVALSGTWDCLLFPPVVLQYAFYGVFYDSSLQVFLVLSSGIAPHPSVTWFIRVCLSSLNH